MFVDPTGTVSVSFPPSWAYDPRSSSLTHLAFVDWTSPATRRAFVDVDTRLRLIGKTDSEWESAVRAELPAEATRIERRPGPVVLVELPSRAEPPGSRLAWLRGARLGVIVEQKEVPLGSALATPELAEALRSLDVPINRHLAKQRDQAEWSAAMEAATHAKEAGDKPTAMSYFMQARQVANARWLYSSVTGHPLPDFVAAIAQAEATLGLALIAGSVEYLYQATTTLYRCRRSLASIPLVGTPTNDYVDRLINKALWLHGEFGKTTTPIDCGQACYVRSVLFQRELANLLECRSQKIGTIPWEVLSNLATLASEDAKTAMALATIGASSRYSDLPGESKAVLTSRGVLDEGSWKKLAHEQEIEVLDTLASAGHALGAVELGAVSVSARAVRADALLAARRLVELAPSQKRFQTLVNAINGNAAALYELGDQESLDEAQSLITEGQAILDRLGDQGTLRAQLCANEAWLHLTQKRTEAGLAVVDRAIALAHAAKQERTEILARSCRCRLLNLAGRHDEALVEARRAVAITHGDGVIAAHEALAMAFYHTGNPAAALDEIREGLVVALADNPTGEAVQSLLSTAALVLEERDSTAALAATEAAEILFDARRRDIGGAVERIAYDDNLGHRELAATLVQRRLGAHDILGALATADRHRARSLAEAAGPQGTAPAGVAYRLPTKNASLADQIAFVATTARAVLQSWGIPPPLDGTAISNIVTSHGRTVVLFHPTGTQLLAFVARPGAPLVIDVVIATASVSEVLGLTDALRQQLGILVAVRAARGHLPPQSIDEQEATLDADDDAVRQADVQLDQLRRELHDALFSEVLPRLHDQEPIIVVPYRELSVIPLAVLTGADGQMLIERHPLSVLPSLASLGALARPAVEPPRGVVVGDPQLPSILSLAPLPGAADEADHVRRMLASAGVDTTPLLGPDATEENFRKRAAGARVVHLACHAALREPASASPLFLTPSEHDDGLLLPAEIADLRLDGALVVLSACQSGLGRATADGVLGLGRAFMQAGARAVVLSLWRVGDAATAHLMPEFYHGLLGTASGLDGRRLDVAAAMRRAQLITRDELSDHPSSWGPWLVVGDGGWRLV
jgi:CHAT domain-containing protein/tetratricopeptide (TPR) repeat protein